MSDTKRELLRLTLKKLKEVAIEENVVVPDTVVLKNDYVTVITLHRHPPEKEADEEEDPQTAQVALQQAEAEALQQAEAESCAKKYIKANSVTVLKAIMAKENIEIGPGRKI